MDNNSNEIIDQSFINHLREEKLKQQDRRASYIRSKFTFVIGLFGFGLLFNLNPKNQQNILWSNGLLYLIPFVAIIFDLYILGGEFAVKRIRGFLSKHDKDMHCEKVWDSYLKEWPKGFMKKNRFWVTNFIYFVAIACILYNLLRLNTSIFEWIWFVLWLILIIFLAVYLVSIEIKIEKASGSKL